jgi:hypothetical protein
MSKEYNHGAWPSQPVRNHSTNTGEEMLPSLGVFPKKHHDEAKCESCTGCTAFPLLGEMFLQGSKTGASHNVQTALPQGSPAISKFQNISIGGGIHEFLSLTYRRPYDDDELAQSKSSKSSKNITAQKVNMC